MQNVISKHKLSHDAICIAYEGCFNVTADVSEDGVRFVASFGKRSWKMWWCVVQDLVLYLYKDEQCGRRSAQLSSQAIRLHHAIATCALDYSKKQHVFRLHTADQAEYLLQTRSV